MKKKILLSLSLLLLHVTIQSQQQNNDTCWHEIFSPEETSHNLKKNDTPLSDIGNEYDRYVCDDAQCEKVSDSMAFFRKVSISFMIYYLALKECISSYLVVAKNHINHWIFPQK